MRLNAIMAVVTVSCVVAVVAGPRIGPLNIHGHHGSRGGAASNNHWREIGMEYLSDEGGAPVVLSLTSALGGAGRRLLTNYSQQDDGAGPGDPINPLGGMGRAFTGQSRFALANSATPPAKSAAAPPAPPAPLSPPSSPPANSGGIQSFVAPTDPPKPPPPGPPDPPPPDPQGPPVIEPPSNPPTPVVVVTQVTPPPPALRPPPAAPLALPEPTTWALMMLGLGAVGAALRRRRGIRMELGVRAT
jgi:hypothetical protein